MSRGLVMTLIASVLALAVGVAGLAVYIFTRSAPGASTPVVAAADGVADSISFFKTKNFVTDLADKERARYIDVTISLGLKDADALTLAKKVEPQIRDIVLGHLRSQVSADFAGSAGKEKLVQALQSRLSELFKTKLAAVYITDLAIQ